MESSRLDPQRQEQARKYAHINRRLSLIGIGFSGLYTLGWLVFGWAKGLRTALGGYTTNPWLLAGLFAVTFVGILSVLSLPLDYYGEFLLPHRFGLSTETLKGWVIDRLKGLLISLPLGLALLEIFYFLLRVQPDTWWLWMAGLLFLLNVLLANLAPVLLMPLFFKFVPLGEEHADLANRLLRLAEQSGAPVRGVFKFDMSRRTRAANAALTGLGNTRRIILGDTLLNEFSSDEIETVMAHELGHQVNKDIPYGILVSSLLAALGLLLAYYALRWGVVWFGLNGPADPASLPLVALAVGVYGLATMPLGNAYSRWRERRADEFALQMTHNGKAFASALTRLANQNLSEVEPEAWVEWLFYSHPALGKRIKMAEKDFATEITENTEKRMKE